METNYLFPMLLARKSGGGGMPSDVKYAANLSLTIDSSTFVVTAQLIDQNGDNLGTAQTIDLPLESVVVDGSYNDQTKKVVLTLQNGNTVEFSVADLVDGLANQSDLDALTDRVDGAEADILSEQAKTTGMTEGGSDYITVNGIRLYVSSIAPTGDIPDGSVGVGW